MLFKNSNWDNVMQNFCNYDKDMEHKYDTSIFRPILWLNCRWKYINMVV